MVKTNRSQAGFTLVELAIVMIIIGLLIGGILKGQELIANAQITATSAQVKAFEAAITTFRDSYNGVPGDILAPNTRLPNCAAAPCNVAGNGNNRVDTLAPGAVQVTGNENSTFWTQLATADMIGGISGTSNVVNVWGGQLPNSETGGGFTVGFAAGALGGGNAVAGHYVSLQQLPNAALTNAANFALTPTQAARIDRKLDDGIPETGSTLVAGAAGAANCFTAAAAPAPGLYNENLTGVLCGLFLRVQ